MLPANPIPPITKAEKTKDKKWELLSNFADLISEIEPDIVSMENVPNLVTFQEGKVYQNFVERLEEDYTVTEYPKVFCPDYGVPQSRKRLVLFASKYGELELLPPTCTPDQYKKVEDAIDGLEVLKAGQVSQTDPYHKASQLSELNLRRIEVSEPGGTWRDWPEELVAPCHLKKSGNTYSSVYGRMKGDETIPHDHNPMLWVWKWSVWDIRILNRIERFSLREAARLQTFPDEYEFVDPETQHYSTTVIGRLIGNAVPIELARVIARSIKNHLETYANESKG